MSFSKEFLCYKRKIIRDLRKNPMETLYEEVILFQNSKQFPTLLSVQFNWGDTRGFA